MLVYVLKSAACLAILLAFYTFFMEKENMHTLKRFYLLGALVAALTIPFVTFVEYVEIPVPTEATMEVIEIPAMTGHVQEQAPIDYLPIVLWSMYLLGALLFGFKFIRNLAVIIQRIRKNPKYRVHHIYNVLLSESIVPHTFLSYIFLNKHKFEARQIPKEVLLHEETHANQKHSWDVLFVEFLQVIFWFNPLMHLVKKAIKLNHEFLADRAVLNKGFKPTTYQNILLEFSSSSLHPQLANAINYSSIKKRFTVMKTQTSKKSKWIKGLLLIPLFTFVVYGFSRTEQVVKNINDSVEASSNYIARSIDIKILEDSTYLVDGTKVNKNALASAVKQLHQDVTPKIRNNIMNIHVSSQSEISNEEVWFIYNSLLDYGFYRMVVPGQDIIRGKGNTPVAIEKKQEPKVFLQKNSQQHEGASFEQMEQYQILSEKYNGLNNLLLKDLERMKYLFSLMTEEQKVEALPFTDLTEAKFQEGATKKQVKEYNTLAKKYSSMSKDNFRILNKEVKRLKHLYSLMTAEQKENAQPFPDFPEPPPPPSPVVNNGLVSNIPAPSPKVLNPKISSVTRPTHHANPFIRISSMRRKGAQFYLDGSKITGEEAQNLVSRGKNKNISLVTTYDSNDKPILYLSLKSSNGSTKIVSHIPPPPPPVSPVIHKGEIKEVPPLPLSPSPVQGEIKEVPPPPPSPKSPEEHMMEMAEKDAVFYYEGKEISSERAIKILKKSKKINLRTRHEGLKRPIVELSTKSYFRPIPNN